MAASFGQPIVRKLTFVPIARLKSRMVIGMIHHGEARHSDA